MTARFLSASGYQDNVLALPVSDIQQASQWYCEHFGMQEVQRFFDPVPSVILQRDGVSLGFAENGGDPEQDGAAIHVQGIGLLKQEWEARGVSIGNWRIDQRDGQDHQVFFAIAPDGLCYYLYEPIKDQKANT